MHLLYASFLVTMVQQSRGLRIGMGRNVTISAKKLKILLPQDIELPQNTQDHFRIAGGILGKPAEGPLVPKNTWIVDFGSIFGRKVEIACDRKILQVEADNYGANDADTLASAEQSSSGDPIPAAEQHAAPNPPAGDMDPGQMDEGPDDDADDADGNDSAHGEDSDGDSGETAQPASAPDLDETYKTVTKPGQRGAPVVWTLIPEGQDYDFGQNPLTGPD
jgi:hypothetical protein